MTYENCLKYIEEAKDEETKKFWADRIARKYPEKIKIVEPIKKSKPKKESKVDGNN